MIYRQQLADFRVQEVPLFPPSGSGDFLYLHVRKTGLDSMAVAHALAAHLRVSMHEIGMAGRKDRWAITEQWFSVRTGDDSKLDEFELEGVEVLATARSHERLRLGQLQGNRFELLVRGVEPGSWEQIAARVADAVTNGFANRFGPQRFGRSGDNAAQGREILAGHGPIKDRKAARFLVSALQSEVFNRSLALRQADIGLNVLMDGDLALMHRSGGLFWIDSAAAEQARVECLELSPTGPLFGDKMRRPFGAAGRWEQQALEDLDLRESMFASRRGLRVHGARRSLRALATDLAVVFTDDVATVSVTLAPGAYASVLLEEVFGDGLSDARRSDAS